MLLETLNLFVQLAMLNNYSLTRFTVKFVTARYIRIKKKLIRRIGNPIDCFVSKLRTDLDRDLEIQCEEENLQYSYEYEYKYEYKYNYNRCLKSIYEKRRVT